MREASTTDMFQAQALHRDQDPSDLPGLSEGRATLILRERPFISCGDAQTSVRW